MSNINRHLVLNEVIEIICKCPCFGNINYDISLRLHFHANSNNFEGNFLHKGENIYTFWEWEWGLILAPKMAKRLPWFL